MAVGMEVYQVEVGMDFFQGLFFWKKKSCSFNIISS